MMQMKFLMTAAILSAAAATPVMAQGVIPWNSSASWLCFHNYAIPNCDPEGYNEFEDVPLGPPAPVVVAVSDPAPKSVRRHHKKSHAAALASPVAH
jgi:hypothetical protein